MKLVQINPVLRRSTSTGRIMEEIGDMMMANGWECFVAYSRGRDGKMKTPMIPLPVGNIVSTALHGITTRIFDRHGLASTLATWDFVRKLKKIAPDIVHIHNIHGYFLNYKILFDFLSKSNIKVVWTVHDCWLYTGHCYHYHYAGCYKWKTGCGNCPQRMQFPKSLMFDRSAQNYIDKKRAFTSMPHDNMVIVPVSQWMRDEMRESYLKDYPFRVIHNGIDTDIFSPQPVEDVKKKYGIAGYDKIILGLASLWFREKGLYDFIEMSKMLRPDEKIVMVGVDDKTRRLLPDNILTIRRTDNVQELAALYSAATAFVNPTWQDNYPTVNLEAQACGTPVVTYRTGGSPESLLPATGRIVEQGDVTGLLEAVREFAKMPHAGLRDACRSHAVANFRKQDKYAEYIDLYNSILRQ
ncbi:MAG: glycosyltransferase [Muribaculum sp.]|nr:glycosyltransferase [Muribaculum sp.]